MSLFAGAKLALDVAEVEPTKRTGTRKEPVSTIPSFITLNEPPQQKLAELPAIDFEAILIRMRDRYGELSGAAGEQQ